MTDSYFSGHWRGNIDEGLPREKLAEAARFLSPITRTLKRGGFKVLDVGCGNGVHYEVLKKFANNTYTGVDIDQHVIGEMQALHNKRDFSVASAEDLPFSQETFDVVFAYGVIGYCDDPKKALSEMVRVCKKDGYIGVWLYPRREDISGLVFTLVRSIFKLLPSLLQRLVANFVVPVLGLLPTSSGLSLSNATWRQCHEVVMVNLAPPQLVFYTNNEVDLLFNENNIKPVNQGDDLTPISKWGLKT
jgi:ubiquinone/menaquinone biosynthesis C-methylase UbiE